MFGMNGFDNTHFSFSLALMAEPLSLDDLCERGLISVNPDGSISTGELQEKIKEGLFIVKPTLEGYKVYLIKKLSSKQTKEKE